MSQFEFLLIFVSLIAAFSVSDILMSWGEEIRLWKQVRHYVVHTAWSLAMLFALVQVWWSLWQFHDKPSWTFPEYLVLVLPFLTLSLMVYVLTPKFSERELDVKVHYYNNARWVFALGAAYLMCWVLFASVMGGDPINDRRTALRILMSVVFLILAIFKNERLHQAGALSMYLLILVMVVSSLVYL
ncbi:MAG: hypothetical protein AAFX85_18105 [Pseudomonadota bacterium]